MRAFCTPTPGLKQSFPGAESQRFRPEQSQANERVMLCTSESDPTLRAARAHTGRDLIAVFSHAAHGLHDDALVTAQFAQAPAANDATLHRKVHIGAGVPASVDENVMVLPYGREQALDMIHSSRHKPAAVIVEPIPSARLSLTHGPRLSRLQQACRTSGVLLILDETFSGFRLCYGGAQEFFDLSPDLVTYGNTMGGGLSIGAVAWRTGIMSVLGGGNPQQRVFCGTTHAGNPLSAAAAVAVLNLLSLHRETVYPQLHEAASNIAEAFNSAAEKLGHGARIETAGSIFHIQFDRNVSGEATLKRERADQRQMEQEFYRHLLDKRVIVHASEHCFLSTAHTVADIGEISAAMIESLHLIKH